MSTIDHPATGPKGGAPATKTSAPGVVTCSLGPDGPTSRVLHGTRAD